MACNMCNTCNTCNTGKRNNNGRRLYAVTTVHCNLSCPHCDVRNQAEVYDAEKFHEQLLNFDGRIIVFGGECTLHRDRFFSIFNDARLWDKGLSVSTNLTILDDEILEVYKRLKGVATSWNAGRFNDDEYQTWLKNLKILEENGIKVTILITLDKELMDEYTPEKFMEMIRSWNFNNINNIKMEQLMGDVGAEFYDRVDDWLCEVHKLWDVPIKNDIDDQARNWGFDCSGVYHLLPDGTLNKGCPHNNPPKVPEECFSCENASSCRPCQRQCYCSKPKKLAALLKEEDMAKEQATATPAEDIDDKACDVC